VARPDAELDAAFESLYAIDLVYRAGCHSRCGDAFCCNFARHKQHFSFLGRRPMQELPLLAGEYEWLAARGWLAQFGEHEHREFSLALPDGRSIHADSIVSTRAGCACDHATRPVICRLYPLLPVFDVDGRLTGVESLTIYDEIERIAGAPRSCKVDDLPFDQLDLWLRFTAVLARRPAWLFQLAAYRVLKQRGRRRLWAMLGLGSSVETLAVDSTSYPLSAQSCNPEDRVLLVRIYRLLDELPAQERLAWTLRYVEGEQVETVASLCGCSLATAKRRIAAAQTFLARTLSDA
jgi:hypothetical protein